MAFLTRDQILTADDIQREVVSTPEWGGDVMVQGLNGTERDQFEAGVVEQRAGKGNKARLNLHNIRAKLVARTVVDPETGQRLFSDADIVALGKKSAVALNRVFEVAQRLSGLKDEDIEELAKNSENGQSEDSTTD